MRDTANFYSASVRNTPKHIPKSVLGQEIIVPIAISDIRSIGAGIMPVNNIPAVVIDKANFAEGEQGTGSSEVGLDKYMTLTIRR